MFFYIKSIDFYIKKHDFHTPPPLGRAGTPPSLTEGPTVDTIREMSTNINDVPIRAKKSPPIGNSRFIWRSELKTLKIHANRRYDFWPVKMHFVKNHEIWTFSSWFRQVGGRYETSREWMVSWSHSPHQGNASDPPGTRGMDAGTQGVARELRVSPPRGARPWATRCRLLLMIITYFDLL